MTGSAASHLRLESPERSADSLAIPYTRMHGCEMLGWREDGGPQATVGGQVPPPHMTKCFGFSGDRLFPGVVDP